MTRRDGEPACETCGGPVVDHRCKRICRRGGLMTGCSEGIELSMIGGLS